MRKINLWDSACGMNEETPVLEYYPAKEKKTDATVVILPGGGYTVRAPHEGKGYAEYLNSIGMDAFVCEYRVAPHRFPLPLLDARRAVQFVRYNAKKYKINPEKVAIMGSSAGGHLAALLSTLFDEFPDILTKKDEISMMDFVPNAQILCYPVIALNDFGHYGSGDNLLGSTDIYAPERYRLSVQNLVSEKTPQAFIWHTATDPGVPVQNSLSYVSALRQKNVTAELHVFPNGGHGMGLAETVPNVAQWAELLKNWFIFNEWLGDEK